MIKNFLKWAFMDHFLSIMFMIGYLGLMWGCTYTHEYIHLRIGSNYGTEGHIEWISEFPAVSTVYDNPELCTEECHYQNIMNEIVSYPLLVGFTLLSLFGYIIIFLLEEWYADWRYVNEIN